MDRAKHEATARRLATQLRRIVRTARRLEKEAAKQQPGSVMDYPCCAEGVWMNVAIEAGTAANMLDTMQTDKPTQFVARGYNA